MCDGTYTPNALADVAGHSTTTTNNEIDDTAGGGETKSQYLANTSKQATSLPVVGIQYPPECFSSLFLENPKLLRLILAHCNKQKCEISPSLRRTLLDLTLEEWNEARRSDDKEKERVRCNQALAVSRILFDTEYYLNIPFFMLPMNNNPWYDKSFFLLLSYYQALMQKKSAITKR